MSFQAFETATETGQPIELYEFMIGSEVFRYTSDQVDYFVSNFTWSKVPISRGTISISTGDSRSERLEIRLPADNALVLKYVSIAPGLRPVMTLFKTHRNDPDKELVTLFKGQIQSVGFSANAREAILQVASLTAAKSRQIPRFTYQNLCNHMLYDVRCKILETNPSFEKFLSVSAVSGNTITATGAGAFGAEFFESGFVGFDGDFRMVVDQVGDVLTFILPFGKSPVGQVVRCLAGCKHRLITDCQDKFANVANFGGFPYVPTKNPFSTGLD